MFALQYYFVSNHSPAVVFVEFEVVSLTHVIALRIIQDI